MPWCSLLKINLCRIRVISILSPKPLDMLLLVGSNRKSRTLKWPKYFIFMSVWTMITSNIKLWAFLLLLFEYICISPNGRCTNLEHPNPMVILLLQNNKEWINKVNSYYHMLILNFIKKMVDNLRNIPNPRFLVHSLSLGLSENMIL